MTQTATPSDQSSKAVADFRSEPVNERRFWARYFEFYDTLIESIPYRRLIERHVDLLELEPGHSVLDAGTGTGNVAIELLERGMTVVGIDFCVEAVDICRQKSPQGRFLVGDLTRRLEFDDESFDHVTCCNVIYTLQPSGQRTAVGELFRVLKPGGAATITVFGKGFKAFKVYSETLRQQRQATGWLDAARRGLRFSINTARILYYVRKIKRQEKSGDYTFFTREQFAELITGAGFEVELMEPVFASQCLMALARKPGRHDGP